MRTTWLLITLLITPPLLAAPLYIERVRSANPDAEALAKAADQIHEHKDVKLREDLKVPPFHKEGPPLKEGEAFCQGCHLPLPHSKKLRTRSFLNMHTRYIGCETCHFRPEDVKFDYRWLDYGSQKQATVENRFRTGRKTDNAQVLDGSRKIAPFLGGEPAIVFPSTPFAEDIAKQWKAGDAGARAKLKARLHAPLKKEGPACGACHTEQNPMLDLIALGAEGEQATAIRRHVIPQFFGRYKADEDRLKIIDILQ